MYERASDSREPRQLGLPIDDCIIFLLGKAFQRVSQDARIRFAPHGISPVQYVVLSALWERDAQSGAQLTSRLRIDSATITGVVDRLAVAGLVLRKPDATDRRIQRIHLTKAGKALRRRLASVVIELNREVAQQFGPRAKPLWTMLRELGSAQNEGEGA